MIDNTVLSLYLVLAWPFLIIIDENEMKGQSKTWIQAVKVVFWLSLDLAYKAMAVQALYAKSNGNQNTWTL